MATRWRPTFGPIVRAARSMKLRARSGGSKRMTARIAIATRAVIQYSATFNPRSVL
jgi:hypothetical protein